MSGRLEQKTSPLVRGWPTPGADLHLPAPVLGGVMNAPPMVVGLDGKEISVMNAARQAFAKDIAHYELSLFEARAAELTALWAKIAAEQIDAEVSELENQFKSSAIAPARDGHGIFHIPFLQGHQTLIIENILSRDSFFATSAPTVQLRRTKEVVKQSVRAQAKQAKEKFIRQMRTTAIATVDDQFRQWLKSAKVGALEVDAYAAAMPMYVELCNSLQQAYPVRVAELSPLHRLLTYSYQGGNYRDGYRTAAIQYDPDSVVTLNLPNKKIQVVYDPEVATFVMTPSERAQDAFPEIGFKLLLLHGATTLGSNLSGWTDLISYFSKYGFSPYAVDMPGSMGAMGIAPSEFKTPVEVAVYLNSRVNKIADFGAVIGRSWGSTQAFAGAAELHIARYEAEKKGMFINAHEPDVYFLTSFANPFTIRDQLKTVQKQMDDGSRKQVFGIVPGSFEQVTQFSDELIRDLDKALELYPNIFDNFGDEIFFVQGEADVDGAPEGKAHLVAKELKKLKEKYAPLSHLYVIPDPLIERPELAARLDPDEREASHFLFSTRGNLTLKNSGLSDFPEGLLPKFSDQNLELMALLYASKDYRIDLSPVTKPSVRESLFTDRKSATESNEPYAYLRWFIKHLNEKLGRYGHSIAFEDLQNPAIQPSSHSLLNRLRRVWVFIHEESEAVKRSTR